MADSVYGERRHFLLVLVVRINQRENCIPRRKRFDLRQIFQLIWFADQRLFDATSAE